MSFVSVDNEGIYDQVQGDSFLSLVDIGQTDSATLTYNLKLLLSTNGFQLTNCCGQAYDSAANTAGLKRITDKEPKAHYIHCASPFTEFMFTRMQLKFHQLLIPPLRD